MAAIGDELSALGGSIIAVNDSPDDAALTALLREKAAAGRPVPVHLVENPRNLGFVRSANTGLALAMERRHDALLLNSDTLVFPGAISEIRRVSLLDPMIGFVSPRSNNATICSLPHQPEFRGLPPEEAYHAFRHLSRFLPRYHFVPTAVGFCLLIKLEMLDEFGLLDECYGAGYNEENDLIMRANRCGYRAALANHAFVYHIGESSFARAATPRTELEARNAELLDRRYPEYRDGVAAYLQSPHYEAEHMMRAMLPDAAGRYEVAFDFTSMAPFHNGTFAAAKQILRRAAVEWRDRIQIWVVASDEAIRFHELEKTPGVFFVPPDTQRVFALAFRFGQPFELGQIARMSRAGVVNVYAMLDPISLDCLYLNEPELRLVWGTVFGCADAVTYISPFAAEQFQRRFRRHSRLREFISYLSLDVRDYACGVEPSAGEHILVVGNHFAHKYVKPTVEALRRAFPRENIVALGSGDDSADGATFHKSGELPGARVAELLAGARFVVFPSHYEGFGIPLLEALAYKRPVLARDIPVARDIRDRIGAHENLILYESTADLIRRLSEGFPKWKPDARMHDCAPSNWDAVVRQLGDFFCGLLDSVDFNGVLVPRIEQMRLLEGLGRLRSECENARAGIAGLERALKDRESQIAGLRNSLSWRMTAPVRALGGICLRLRGR